MLAKDYAEVMPDLDAYLEGKHRKNVSSSKVTLSLSELESALMEWGEKDYFVEYILGIMSGSVTAAVEKIISEKPVSFVSKYVKFVTALADTRGDGHKLEIRRHTYMSFSDDFAERLESIILNLQQLEKISYAEDKFNKLDRTKGVARRIELTKSGNHIDGVCAKLLTEHLNQGDSPEHRAFLMAMDGLIHYTKSKKSFDSCNLGQLVTIYRELQLQIADQNGKRTNERMYASQLLAGQEVSRQLECALGSKLLQLEANDDVAEIALSLKDLNRGKGAKPDSFGMTLLEAICRSSENESSDSTWWEPLNLSELLEVMRRKSVFQIGILDATAKGDWLRKKVERHVAESDSVKDFAVALEANAVFGVPDAEGLIRVWKTVAGNSVVLQDIEAELVSSPLQMMKLKGETVLSEQAILHQKVIAELKAEIAKLQSAISSLDAAMQKGRENLGDAKLGLEMGVTKKFAEALARLVRRMEREAGKAPFQEILAKEVNGLSRLGMTVITAGTVEPFDPAKHDSIGVTISLGANVTIIETGLLLLLGKDKITVLKAVVHPAA